MRYIVREVIRPLSLVFLAYLLVPYALAKLALSLYARPLSPFMLRASDESTIVATSNFTTPASDVLCVDDLVFASKLLGCVHLFTFVSAFLVVAVWKTLDYVGVLHDEIRKEK